VRDGGWGGKGKRMMEVSNIKNTLCLCMKMGIRKLTETYWKIEGREKRKESNASGLIWPKYIICMCEISQWNPFVQVIYIKTKFFIHCEYMSFVRHMCCKYFSPVCELLLHFFSGIFWWTEVLGIIKVQFTMFFLHGLCFWVTFNKPFIPKPWRWFVVFCTLELHFIFAI
jgi:hypothetical protein